jgi:hypothetical protein
MPQWDMRLSLFLNERNAKTPEFKCSYDGGVEFFVECKSSKKGHMQSRKNIHT